MGRVKETAIEALKRRAAWKEAQEKVESTGERHAICRKEDGTWKVMLWSLWKVTKPKKDICIIGPHNGMFN